MKHIVLIHKHFLNWGGAERFLIEEYNHLSDLNSRTELLILNVNKNAQHHLRMLKRPENVKIFHNPYILNLVDLFRLLNSRKDCHVVCASGHLEVGLICQILNINYSLHLHHPSFMTMNDTDIYRFRGNKVFNILSNTYESGKLIIEHRKKLGLLELILYRLKSIFSINSIKKAKYRFVHSKYHQLEKKLLYDIECNCLNGAYSKSQLEQIRPNNFKQPNPGELRLLSICRLVSNKRVMNTVKCIEYLNNVETSQVNVTLTIVGVGDEYEHINKYIQNKNIMNIKLHGFADHHEINNIITCHDIFLALDIGDFKLNMHEALLMHMPVICSQETEVPDLLMQSNYVIKTDLEPASLSNAISIMNYRYKSKLLDSRILEVYLRSMSWKTYFNNMNNIILK